MSLIDSMMDKCIIMNKITESDGQGGYNTTWTEGAVIDVAITLDTSLNARIAEKDGFSNTYTLTTHKGTALDYHDVIKRVKDGLVLRVTSDERVFPAVASAMLNDYTQVNAEKWSLS